MVLRGGKERRQIERMPRTQGMLAGIIVAFLATGLIVTVLVYTRGEKEPEGQGADESPRADGEIANVDYPSPVEGREMFVISIGVRNTGNIDTNFSVELSSQHLEITSSPSQKYIAQNERKTFDFSVRPLYMGQPEVSTTLSFRAYAGGNEVDSRQASLRIFMPQVEFTGYSVSKELEWFDGWWVIKLTLEVKNKGRASATNTSVYAALLEGATVRDSASEYVGYLVPGASDTVTLTLDGDFFHEYRFSIEVEDAEGSSHNVESEQFRLVPDIDWVELALFLLPYI